MELKNMKLVILTLLLLLSISACAQGGVSAAWIVPDPQTGKVGLWHFGLWGGFEMQQVQSFAYWNYSGGKFRLHAKNFWACAGLCDFVGKKTAAFTRFDIDSICHVDSGSLKGRLITINANKVKIVYLHVPATYSQTVCVRDGGIGLGAGDFTVEIPQ